MIAGSDGLLGDRVPDGTHDALSLGDDGRGSRREWTGQSRTAGPVPMPQIKPLHLPSSELIRFVSWPVSVF